MEGRQQVEKHIHDLAEGRPAACRLSPWTPDTKIWKIPTRIASIALEVANVANESDIAARYSLMIPRVGCEWAMPNFLANYFNGQSETRTLWARRCSTGETTCQHHRPVLCPSPTASTLLLSSHLDTAGMIISCHSFDIRAVSGADIPAVD